MEHNRIQYGTISHIAASANYQESETRAYFDGTFTSTSPDLNYRVIPEAEFDKIIAAFVAGLRVLDSHKQDNNGLGKTVHAAIVEQAIRGSFYIFKGMKEGDQFERMKLVDQSYPDTMSWIMGLKDGMIDRCSMGWFSERDLCNLCNESIYSYKCRHYPGERFPITDEETGEETMQTCTYSCYGITPVELSLVYYGANPDARLITKAKAMADQFTAEQIDRIESDLKVAIVDGNRSIFDMKLDKEAQQQVAQIVADEIKKHQAAPQAGVLPNPNGSYNIVDAAGNVVSTIAGDKIPQPEQPLTAAALGEVMTEAMKPVTEALGKVEKAVKAGDGLDDREKAIAEGVKQYTRVYGKDGDTETHKALLESQPDVASIQSISDAHKKTADTLFKAGRSTAGLGDEIEGGEGEGDQAAQGQGNTSNPM